MCQRDCQFTTRTRQHLLEHIRQRIPTKLSLADIGILPRRADFLDQARCADTQSLISRGQPILFMPNQTLEKPEYIAGDLSFVIWTFGITPCGLKTAVRVTGVVLDYTIFVPDKYDVAKFESDFRNDMSAMNIEYTGTEIVHLKPLKGWCAVDKPALTVRFENMPNRKKCIEWIAALNLKRTDPYRTCNDDAGFKDFYFAKFAREGAMNSADWNVVSDYTVLPGKATADICISVDATKIVAIGDSKADWVARYPYLEEALVKDPLVCASWDIETYRTVQNGQVPTPADTDFVIFMMNQTFAFHYTGQPFLDFSACETDSDVHPDQQLLMICGTPKGVLQAHMEMHARINPDITAAFHGSNFDWPLFKVECERNGLANRLRQCYSTLLGPANNDLKWCFTSEKVKIDAENSMPLACVGMFSGCIDIDTQAIFKKMYNRAEVGRGPGSLNFYLSKNDLAGKEDMPYKRMFRVYERMKLFQTRSATVCHCGERCDLCETCVPELDMRESVVNAEHVYGPERLGDPTKCCVCDKLPRCKRDMALVSNYCRIDCVRPHQLLAKRMIVRDKRELSNLSYMCLRDSFFRADGVKVRNKIGREARKMGIAFSNKPTRMENSAKEHYPGAYVLPPRRGLHTRRPIAGLDFASLYPSIKMTNNRSPDMLVGDITTARQLLRAGYRLNWIPPFEYERGEKKGAISNARLKAEGWTVDHRDVINIGDRQTIGYDKWVTVMSGDKVIVTYIEKSFREIRRDYASMSDEEVDTWLRTRRHTELSFNMTVSDQIALINGALNADPLTCDARQPDFLQRFKMAEALAARKLRREVKMKPVIGGPALPNERMGIFPTIVKDLFDKRVPVKNTFRTYEKLAERYEKGVADGIIHHGGTIEHQGEHLTIDEIEFRANCADAKQRGLKVLANTFYGESGNFRSSVYAILVAAGITSDGQYALKSVIAFMRDELKFDIYYGDTDSGYESAPEYMFEAMDAAYEAALMARFSTVDETKCAEACLADFTEIRREYWTQLVDCSMKCFDIAGELVWDFLIEMCGKLYLKMAYEEVCFPTVMCGKKKYFATAHQATINFDAPKTFIRGIEVIKQGQTKIGIDLGHEFMNDARSVSNVLSLLDLAKQKITKFYSGAVDPVAFSQMATYKPEKKNMAVHRFVDRMRVAYEQCTDPMLRALYEPPEAGDKFRYVVVVKPQEYMANGNIIKQSKGDCMEYLRVFMQSPGMILDRAHYAESSIAGIFSRFIASEPQFQPVGIDGSTDEGWKIIDVESNENAKDYIIKMCEALEGSDSASVRAEGARIRKEYRAAAKVVNGAISAKFGARAIDLMSSDGPLVDRLKQIKYWAPALDADRVSEFVAKCAPMSIHRINACYGGQRGILESRRNWIAMRRNQLTEAMFAIVRELGAARSKYLITLGNRIVPDDSDALFTEEEARIIASACELSRDWNALDTCERVWNAFGESLKAARVAALDELTGGSGAAVSLGRAEVRALAAGAVAAVGDYGDI